MSSIHRLGVIVAAGLMAIGFALAVVNGTYPIGGKVGLCESDFGVQNFAGLGEVSVADDIWMTSGSSVYRSSFVRGGAVELVPKRVRVLDLPSGLEVVDVLASRPHTVRGLLSGGWAGSGPIEPHRRAEMIPLDEVSAAGWHPIVQIRINRAGDYRILGLRISYRAGLRTVACEHTSGVEFTAVGSG